MPASLSSKQQKALTELLAQPSVKAAAVSAGVSEASLWRWLQVPAFQEALRQARGRVLECTLTALQSASQQAVETLTTIMKDSLAHPTARVSAARTVLEMTIKGREILEVEARLAALEQNLEKSDEYPKTH